MNQSNKGCGCKDCQAKYAKPDGLNDKHKQLLLILAAAAALGEVLGKHLEPVPDLEELAKEIEKLYE